MTYLVRPVDPKKVAALNHDDYTVLMNAVKWLNAVSNEADIPAEVQTKAFRIMRDQLGVKVVCFSGMKLAAFVITNRIMLIERLRESVH